MTDNKITYTPEFKNDLKKIKEKSAQTRIEKLIQKIIDNPTIGKPLCHDLVGLRSVRFSPFRLIYEFKANKIILHKFEHRKKVYR
ncbi:MAG: type II toxin-antitoxin system RelE/ParE family toxin [Candidatus Aenigmarchaeota archaeon]|nr:type II toxin-antitoxin system RelE/ParE family toxin [Candidatus Aenigmarchaeota archaeon]